MRIVFATDGSTGALGAAGFLSQLALTADDELHVLSVDPLARGKQEEIFAETREALGDTSVEVREVVRAGAPAQQIVEYARECEADLIALGAMGETGLARFFIGSVAERVLRHAHTHVLVARPVRFGLQRAMVAVDLSPFAERVVEMAAALPLPATTEERLVTVMPATETLVGIAPMVWASLSGDLEGMMDAEQEEREQRLKALAGIVKSRQRRVSAEIQRGDPATELLHAVDKEQIDLLILGSRGEGGVDRYLLGSVSERAARHAHCSVLVVR